MLPGREKLPARRMWRRIGNMKESDNRNGRKHTVNSVVRRAGVIGHHTSNKSASAYENMPTLRAAEQGDTHITILRLNARTPGSNGQH
jgi:Mg-chelatase subunit ChlD